MAELIAHPLPKRLQEKYRAWRDSTYSEDQAHYRTLAEIGQSPTEMVIACCDSRVLATSIFGAGPGDMFVHRNIAALVPPYQRDGDHHGTSAAIEYAVTALKVGHILVVGHSRCGGVEGCYRMCNGEAPELERPDSFVGRWINLLSPRYDRLPDGSDAERLRAFEKEAVKGSLENLMTFPFVAEAVDAGRLEVHGLWVNIAEGNLDAFDKETNSFVSL